MQGARSSERRRRGERLRSAYPQAGVLQALASPSMYPGKPAVQLRETHSSWVFLAGGRAYKVKKPLELGFLDYSTLARRHAACREEVKVNRPLAPDIYLGVRALVQRPGGFRLAREETPEAVEYLVEMRRFDERDTLAGLIDRRALKRADVEATARFLADFHRRSPPATGGGHEPVLSAWRANIAELQRSAHPTGWRLQSALYFGEAFVAAHAPELERRALRGLVRDGHGDLRCEHVLVSPQVRVVDRIEFDPQLRRIDVAWDLAFLAMDLEARGARAAAESLVSAYRRAGLSPGGAWLRAFYAAYWALVRAKVALLAPGEDRYGTSERQLACAQDLWQLAQRLCWRARKPLAVVLCGPAASGKSTLAAALSRQAEMTVVSSDVMRKAAAGLRPDERARAEHYRESFTHLTYELLGSRARTVLRDHDAVIVDATCRTRFDRALLLGRIARANVNLLFVHCELPLKTACERATRRLSDPARVSDATPEIVAEQYRSFQPPEELPADTVLHLDMRKALDAQLDEVALALDRRTVARHPHEPRTAARQRSLSAPEASRP